MVLFLSGADSRALRRIPDEIALLRQEVAGLRVAVERIATELETQPPAQEPTSLRWTTGTPAQEG